MARSSSRSASRELPSSPPNRASPVRRITRSTRSQSVDLDAPPSRQGSVESEARSRRVARKAAVTRDLSAVAEDRELLSEEEAADQGEEEEDEAEEVEDRGGEVGDQGEEEEDEAEEVGDQGEEEEEDEDPDATKVAEPSEFDLQDDDLESNQPHSPAMTAKSDKTVNTQHTERMMETIDPKSAIATLPELYDMARRIINKSANEESRPKDMERHLKVLRALGDGLEALKEPYGDQKFIEVDIVLKKLSSSKGPGAEAAVPLLAILNSANIATLISEVNEQRQSGQDLDKFNQEKLKVFLQSLEKAFPGPFGANFTAPTKFGGSKLIEESFDLFLDIRTQLFITVSRRLEADQPNFDPDEVMKMLFRDGPDRKGYFGDIELEELDERTDERMVRIREFFKPPEQATDPGEYIDFDRLDGSFPRSKFFENLVSYSKKRLAEVENIVESRGGIKKVIKLLEDIETEPEIDIPFNSPKTAVGHRSDSSLQTSSPQPKTKQRYDIDQFTYFIIGSHVTKRMALD
ncbi:hypothetical protein NHQ30_005992 [Ciborinia camelliae]|nr:hypothetical protein NHQ30_005992 [Ciborinia camelliae]